MNCRFCGAPLEDVFVDLGAAPPSNAFLTAEQLREPEAWLQLKLFTCRECHLVQVDEIVRHEALFAPDYAYFSSISSSWVEHAARYVELAVARLGLGDGSLVVEVASNDGYLLQHMAARGIPSVGIEPTSGTAEAARARGIETVERFFGESFATEFAAERGRADLMIANNVLAHVPDINDFVRGFAVLLAQNGVATFEFPHLYELVKHNQFDTIYHEHFSYLSFHTAQRIFAAHGLRVFDVEQLWTHGGSLRLWVCHENASHADAPATQKLLTLEHDAGMFDPAYYRGFQAVAEKVKDDFVRFLRNEKAAGRVVAGYGAAAKGNTLLNFAGVKSDLITFVADRSEHKQGRFLPGSHIPVTDESHLRDPRPDVVVIFPWNLREEITTQLSYIKEWGGRFAVAIPALEVFS